MSTEIELDRSSGLPAEGTHLFKIIKAEEKAAKASGDPTWYLTAECQTQGEDLGKQVFFTISLSLKAKFKRDEFLDAVEAPKHGKWTVEKCTGKLLRMTIQHSVFNGKDQAKVAYMLPASSKNEPIVPSSPTRIGGEIPADAKNKNDKKPF
jgi:hypothetical protein